MTNVTTVWIFIDLPLIVCIQACIHVAVFTDRVPGFVVCCFTVFLQFLSVPCVPAVYLNVPTVSWCSYGFMVFLLFHSVPTVVPQCSLVYTCRVQSRSVAMFM